MTIKNTVSTVLGDVPYPLISEKITQISEPIITEKSLLQKRRTYVTFNQDGNGASGTVTLFAVPSGKQLYITNAMVAAFSVSASAEYITFRIREPTGTGAIVNDVLNVKMPISSVTAHHATATRDFATLPMIIRGGQVLTFEATGGTWTGSAIGFLEDV